MSCALLLTELHFAMSLCSLLSVVFILISTDRSWYACHVCIHILYTYLLAYGGFLSKLRSNLLACTCAAIRFWHLHRFLVFYLRIYLFASTITAVYESNREIKARRIFCNDFISQLLSLKQNRYKIDFFRDYGTLDSIVIWMSRDRDIASGSFSI